MRPGAPLISVEEEITPDLRHSTRVIDLLAKLAIMVGPGKSRSRRCGSAIVTLSPLLHRAKENCLKS